MRACRELGIASVAVYSEADKEALFVKYADEAFLIGPAPATQSYLNIAKVIEAARQCGADAIHPGYGFLAENPRFALACEEGGIKFIGPSSRVLDLMGDKITARQEMIKAGVPVVPGTNECVVEFERTREKAGEIGYPVIVKPSGGGGGIGMTIVENEGDLFKALESCAGHCSHHLRPRRCLHREIPVQSPPHRVSDPGGWLGKRRPPRGAGMLHPAQPPETDRRVPFSRGQRPAPGRDGRGGEERGQVGGVRRGRDSGIPFLRRESSTSWK